MIKLINMLLSQYADQNVLYLCWRKLAQFSDI